jgi:hypothetical protein
MSAFLSIPNLPKIEYRLKDEAGYRLGAGGNEKVNFGEDVFEGLQAGFIDWHTSMLKQAGTESKR